jgi:hypothetical protein
LDGLAWTPVGGGQRVGPDHKVHRQEHQRGTSAYWEWRTLMPCRAASCPTTKKPSILALVNSTTGELTMCSLAWASCQAADDTEELVPGHLADGVFETASGTMSERAVTSDKPIASPTVVASSTPYNSARRLALASRVELVAMM